MSEAVSERRIANRIDRFGISFGTIRGPPGAVGFLTRFLNGHLEWGVGHPEWRKIHPVFRTCQASGLCQPVVKRCCRERRELAKDGQARRPGVNFLKRAVRYTLCVV